MNHTVCLQEPRTNNKNINYMPVQGTTDHCTLGRRREANEKTSNIIFMERLLKMKNITSLQAVMHKPHPSMCIIFTTSKAQI